MLIGSPVEHSLSPGMHSVIYSLLDINWEYLKEDVPEPELGGFIAKVKNNSRLAGFNVTIPHKRSIIKYLDCIDDKAKTIGAVNTVKKTTEGLFGYNTDWMGFLTDLEELIGSPPSGKDCVLFGCGGGALAVIEALSYSNCKLSVNSKIFVYDLDSERALEVSRKKRINLEVIAIGKDELPSALKRAKLFINASPLGMREGDPAPVNLSQTGLKNEFAVYDLVYNRKTELLREAERLMLKARGGIGMLAGQGLEAFKIWYDEKIEDKKLSAIKAEMIKYLRGKVKVND